MGKKFFITTPIYYVNDVPHIGHTCTTVAADIIARYHKLSGKNVFFLTGTDEHGAKVAEAAKRVNLSPKEFCDKVSKTFLNMWPKLDIEYDYFIRTTNPQHEKIVKEVLIKIYKKGDIYKGKYEGYYCVGCEKFVTETDLVNKRCPLHPNKAVVKQSEENYFFRLSKYVPILIEAIENKNHPLHYEISPESKRNEILTKLKSGVSDLSISRAQVEWGIPIPWDKNQTVYVWIDALFNYYTATEITNKKDLWPADIHLIGKEIIWFHAVIWEALLLSAEFSLPKSIFAHSFYTINGQKMSKSLGNVISPLNLIEKFGVDGTRYLIASSFPAFEDSNVGLGIFTKKYNADLANGLGNLISRLRKLVLNFNLDFPIGYQKTNLSKNICQKMEKLNLSGALEEIWRSLSLIDKILNLEKPWESKKKAKTVLEKILFGKKNFSGIREINNLLKPFIPRTAVQIEERLSLNSNPEFDKPLFPRIEKV